ncbi:MAG TPA: DUF6321 domain-containing protein [Gemmatimonadales bacterium]|nr:DUF6321 domain-containing protein [Gemmatimonadales bacterium]
MTARRTARSRKKATQDPRGGLTAAGRTRLRRTEGAHLRPGVKKQRQSEMTPAEMRRKGSWAVRFYGRKKLPPLVTANGKPTRFALTAAAWGEPVPKTVAAARRIAAKGKRLLEAYRRKSEQKKPRGRGKAAG